jgi:hypothetical protein
MWSLRIVLSFAELQRCQNSGDIDTDAHDGVRGFVHINDDALVAEPRHTEHDRGCCVWKSSGCNLSSKPLINTTVTATKLREQKTMRRLVHQQRHCRRDIAAIPGSSIGELREDCSEHLEGRGIEGRGREVRLESPKVRRKARGGRLCGQDRVEAARGRVLLNKNDRRGAGSDVVMAVIEVGAAPRRGARVHGHVGRGERLTDVSLSSVSLLLELVAASAAQWLR